MQESKITFDDKFAVLLERQNRLMLANILPLPENIRVYEEDKGLDNSVLVASMMRNIEDLGFIFSAKLFEVLSKTEEEELMRMYNRMMPILLEKVGAHVEHKPFYPNFPKQVMEKSDFELYLTAILHYWTMGEWKPEYQKKLRLPLHGEGYQLRQLDWASSYDFLPIFTTMMSSKGSLSERDRDLLIWYMENAETTDVMDNLLRAEISSKEILGIVAMGVMQYHEELVSKIQPFIKTATDVLRFAVACSGGDVSLASATKFRNFKRKERKFIMHLLNSASNIEEDMSRFSGEWVRLGEKLHPGEYGKKFPKAVSAFTKIREGVKIETFAGKVDKAFKVGDIQTALDLLKTRGGELARKLDYLLRTYPANQKEIISTFEEVSENVSTPVLLQVMAHFKGRVDTKPYRTFFPKGNLAKAQVIENTLPELGENACHGVVEVCVMALLSILQNKSPLGNVYIDPMLVGAVVPLVQRSASAGLKTYARGSRFTISEDAKILRGFIHWKNPESDDYEQLTDVDLSAVLYDEDWNYVDMVSYTHLKNNALGITHSGDVRNAPNGASEFVDLDLNVVRENNVRYLVFNVFSFSRQNFCDIPECFFGWMERDEGQAGEIFEPKTVVNKIDLASESTICIPVIFDILEGKFIWVDLALKSTPNWGNNVESNHKNIALTTRAMVELQKPNLYDLFRINALARGTIVNTPEEADFKIGIAEDSDLTPFDTETILADFL